MKCLQDLLVSETQKRLSLWATEHPNEKRRELYNLLYHDKWIRQAHDNVKQNAGSMTAGCDGITMKFFDENLEENLRVLQEELKAKTFEAYPVRRAYIPKSPNKWRPLGIPSIKDRIGQEALRMVLEPIFEADFSQYSFGFRPNRCTMDAIRCMLWSTQEHKKYFWAIEGDISSYFDTINHRKLVELLRRRIADRDIIQLVWNFLRAGVMEKKLFRDTKRGTPQGGICSPLLANIYLHELDRYMQNYTGLSQREKTKRRGMGLANFIYIRYADGFVILCNGTGRHAEALKQELKQFLQETLSLTLSDEKTKITHLNEGFKFLGFWIQRKKGHHGMTTKVLIPQEAIHRVKDKIACITDKTTYVNAMNAEITALKRVIGGWCRYYQYTSKASTIFHKIEYYAYWRTAHWIARKYEMTIPEVIKRYGEKHTFATDEVKLMKANAIKTRKYKKRFLKANPYTGEEGIWREELPVDTYWTGHEARPGIMDLRPSILRRDEYTCQLCKKQYKKHQLQVDHKRPVHKFKDPQHANDLNNLWTLCMTCHERKTKADQQMESRTL